MSRSNRQTQLPSAQLLLISNIFLPSRFVLCLLQFWRILQYKHIYTHTIICMYIWFRAPQTQTRVHYWTVHIYSQAFWLSTSLSSQVEFGVGEVRQMRLSRKSPRFVLPVRTWSANGPRRNKRKAMLSMCWCNNCIVDVWLWRIRNQ